jgi:hypothetical protein
MSVKCGLAVGINHISVSNLHVVLKAFARSSEFVLDAHYIHFPSKGQDPNIFIS